MRFSNKLSLVILTSGMIVLILSSFTVYKIGYDSAMKSQFMYTKSIADEVSNNIDRLLHEKVKTALTLANAPIIKRALETSDSYFANLPDEKRKESIKLLDEKWKSTKDPTDKFILRFTDNKVSHFLKNQQALLKGEYGEIFLTNKFGALVASTSKLSTFAHGHKYWWLRSHNNGEGAVFFDDRGYDDSVGGYVLGLVVPIRKGTEIIGILKCNLNILGSVSALISGTKDKLIGKFKLTRSGGMVVFEKGFEPLSTQIHDAIFRKLKSKKIGSIVIDDAGEKYLVGFSEVKLTRGEKGYGFGGTFESFDHKKGNTGESWYVLCYRQMSVVLAPITESIKSILFIGSALILILVLISQLFGRKIARPLAILDKATAKIGKGDFEYRIDIRRNDEFGNLARSFNRMVKRLQQTTTSIVDLNKEIDERKQAEGALRESEKQLARSKRMEAMGLMAGGVAHDLNNILSGIVSYPELLLIDLPEDSPLRNPIKTIQESGMRAVDVVADLLTIARGVATAKEITNLNTLIKGYLNSAEHQKLVATHPFITFKTELDSDLLNLRGSPTHIKKILMNLIANASEAIERSGTVTISTANRYLDEPLKGYEDMRTGEYAVLTVSDDGSGISPQDLENIFEPFYTKKVMGRIGTGLGLAVVWNSVLDHNGHIDVKSGEKGTMFELYFPVTREEVAEAEEEVPVEDYLGHEEKILVVDDEERQIEIASGMLTRLGYDAEAVSSGEEAIEYVKEHPVDLIVLDMVMPKGINGRKTYEEIIKIRPGQKAIIASGYAKTKEVDLVQGLGAGEYIKKPYTLAKMGIALKKELGK